MKKLIVGFSIFLLAGVISSCSQKNTSKFPGYEEVDKGLYIKFLAENETGRQVVPGDVLTMSMIYKREDDSLLFESSKIGQPVQIRVDSAQYQGDILGAFLRMKEGDSASIIMSADSFFLKMARMPELPEFIDSASNLIFEVGIEKVESLEELQAAEAQKNAELEAAEEGLLKQYLADNNITATPRESGLIYIPTKVGNGKQAAAGKNVKVNYSGQLLDGTYFDTSIEEIAKEQGIFNPQRPYTPLDFVLGQGRVIPGWDEGIALMKEGEKARLIIPSRIAYGANPRPGGVIKPFATLVFDVELVEVTDQ